MYSLHYFVSTSLQHSCCAVCLKSGAHRGHQIINDAKKAVETLKRELTNIIEEAKQTPKQLTASITVCEKVRMSTVLFPAATRCSSLFYCPH
jgi:hypothetical protein